MATDYSTLASQAASWVDLIATVIPKGGTPIRDVDIASLSPSATRTRSVQMKHGRPYARTRGSRTYACGIAFFLSGWQAVRPVLKALAAEQGVDIFEIEFDIIAKRQPLGSAVVETLKIERCVIDEESYDFSEGDDPEQVSMTLNIMNIVEMDDGDEVNLG